MPLLISCKLVGETCSSDKFNTNIPQWRCATRLQSPFCHTPTNTDKKIEYYYLILPCRSNYRTGPHQIYLISIKISISTSQQATNELCIHLYANFCRNMNIWICARNNIVHAARTHYANTTDPHMNQSWESYCNF